MWLHNGSIHNMQHYVSIIWNFLQCILIKWILKNGIILIICCILWMLPLCHHTHIAYKLYHKKGCNFAALVVGCLANCIINYSAKHWEHLCPASGTVMHEFDGFLGTHWFSPKNSQNIGFRRIPKKLVNFRTILSLW